MLLKILGEYGFIVIFFLIFITQVLIPGWNGRKLFPILRKESQIKSEIIEVDQQIYEQKLQEKLERKKSKIHN